MHWDFCDGMRRTDIELRGLLKQIVFGCEPSNADFDDVRGGANGLLFLLSNWTDNSISHFLW